MANTNLPAALDLPAMLENEKIKARFFELLKESTPSFVSTLLQIWNGNTKLQDCTAKSILGAAGLAATLNLSISPSLGHAYIVPYKGQATFQIGIRGLIQLAHRTGLYTALNSNAVREGEIRGVDVITGDLITGEKVSDKVVGYVAYMRLKNGFEKALYMIAEEIQAHAEKYSQSYAYDLRSNKKSSVWSTNFDAMAKKTVLKSLINRWGVISSSALATALQADQSVVTKDTFGYIDNDGRTVQRDDYSQLDNGAVETVENVDAETGEILETESA